MTPLLQRLLDAGVLSVLDMHFARGLARLHPDEPESVFLGAALASRAVRHGHVCADLHRVLSQPLLDEEGQPLDVVLPGLSVWAMDLSASPLVSAGERPTPLVFDGGARLYLARYWRYQTALAKGLRERVERRPGDVDPGQLGDGLDRLFSERGEHQADPWQRLAAVVAAQRGLTVISGGPGTGKTSTVVRILALLQEQALARGDRPLRMQLFAPTGKAAARLGEAISERLQALPIDDAVRRSIPTQPSTIHRGLGFRPSTPTHFTHDSTNPLPVDLALVDEASMVDLALMAKLVDAVPPGARLVLLGDKNQLASVEAGAILGDVCRTDARPGYSPQFRQELQRVAGQRGLPEDPREAGTPGIGDCIVELAHSYRFSAEGGIGGLARAVNRGDGEATVRALGEPVPPDRVGTHAGAVAWVELSEQDELSEILRPAVLEGFEGLMRGREPEERLEALGRFRLLSPHRQGRYGVLAINRLVEELLSRAGLISTRDVWYDGRPVIVTENDHQLELYNGDVGFTHRDAHGQTRVVFGTAGGGLRWLAPARLPPHETVFAMTVHKSQGSEFERVALCLPAAVSPVLTRELVYTAITRARKQIVVYGTPQVLEEAVRRRIDRASGLREALWGG
ncbi:exodeoxyribonuclease V subunit alpha [Paraliomyxa miuraensis]|uniref:exodeoxyribonuclease V subunit alpha n=1 Tax=Paraliomyxa miuraensis TaxID=376150 RepID=UPI00225492B9|nr:exodeoxyribonuclease V subunit alpha [Paraliomyxa miuraensis]MCX4242295.1 exodeoxyribonuclease V subunit alpha [Paraliomyxa miuraensis]